MKERNRGQQYDKRQQPHQPARAGEAVSVPERGHSVVLVGRTSWRARCSPAAQTPARGRPITVAQVWAYVLVLL